MIAFPAGMQVIVATQPIDFRKDDSRPQRRGAPGRAPGTQQASGAGAQGVARAAARARVGQVTDYRRDPIPAPIPNPIGSRGCRNAYHLPSVAILEQGARSSDC